MTTLLSMTVSASVIIAALIVIRSLFIHRLPKRLFVILWAIAALRMLVPFSISINIPHENTQPEKTLVREYGPSGSSGEADGASGSPDCGLIPEIIWARGAAISLGIVISLNLRSRRELSTALPLEDMEITSRIAAEKFRRRITVKVSDRVTSPLTYGVINPVIVLPKGLPADSEEMRYALAHELVHIRRFDVLLKLALTAAACMHWFNPLAWVMLSLAGRDIELSCDEAVLKQLGCDREDYAMALIRLEERRSIPTGAAFGRNAVRERIEAIMKFKKTTLTGIIVSACLIAGTTTAFATVNSDKPTQEASPAAEEAFVDNTSIESIDYDEIEWWTYDEYKAWLEQEKENIAELVKQSAYGWTHDRGDFIWTQEVADETIALYEQNLEDIRNGAHISKSVNGNDDLIIIYRSPDGSNMLIEDNGGQYGSDEVYQYTIEEDGTVLYSDDTEFTFTDSGRTDADNADIYSSYTWTEQDINNIDELASQYASGLTQNHEDHVVYIDSDGTVMALCSSPQYKADQTQGVSGEKPYLFYIF